MVGTSKRKKETTTMNLTPDIARTRRDDAKAAHAAALKAGKPEAEVGALYAAYWLQQHRYNLAVAQAAEPRDEAKVEKLTKLIANIEKRNAPKPLAAGTPADAVVKLDQTKTKAKARLSKTSAQKGGS